MSRDSGMTPVREDTARWVLQTPDRLDPAQRALHDRIVSGPRGAQAGQVPLTNAEGALLGPFSLMTIAPQVGDAVQRVGAELRFGTSLNPIVREAAILLVAVDRGCAFEWIAHAGSARQAGLTAAQLAALRRGDVPDELEADVALALRSVRALLLTGTLDETGYSEALLALGEQALAELVWLCGYYSMLALAVAVFRPPDPGE
jgi:4-carboxymuconolactone decarboxylase